MFLDANNLYGKAMMDFLPVGGFRWMSMRGTDGRVHLSVCLMKMSTVVSLTACCFTPSALHDVHDDYPLAPVKWKVSYEDLSPHAKKMCDRHQLKHHAQQGEIVDHF